MTAPAGRAPAGHARGGVSNPRANADGNGVVSVTARELYAEMHAGDEAHRDDVRLKYLGRRLRVSGVVEQVRMVEGKRQIELVADDVTGQAFCQLERPDDPDAAVVKHGDAVTLECISAGWMGGPMLDQCRVVK